MKGREDGMRTVMDAIQPDIPITEDRIKTWQTALIKSSQGEYRSSPVYVVKGRGKYQEDIYQWVPAERIEDEMRQLLAFTDENPIIHAAIVSFWFVAIHPFADGNGRISRALFDAIASHTFPFWKFFSMDSILLKRREAYYAQLQRVSGQNQSLDLTGWILWNFQVVQDAADSAIDGFKQRMTRSSFVKQLDPSQYNSRELFMLYRLADGTFFGKLNGRTWMQMTKCSAAAASRDINNLLSQGLLIPSHPGGYVLNEEMVERVR